MKYLIVIVGVVALLAVHCASEATTIAEAEETATEIVTEISEEISTEDETEVSGEDSSGNTEANEGGDSAESSTKESEGSLNEKTTESEGAIENGDDNNDEEKPKNNEKPNKDHFPGPPLFPPGRPGKWHGHIHPGKADHHGHNSPGKRGEKCGHNRGKDHSHSEKREHGTPVELGGSHYHEAKPGEFHGPARHRRHELVRGFSDQRRISDPRGQGGFVNPSQGLGLFSNFGNQLANRPQGQGRLQQPNVLAGIFTRPDSRRSGRI